MRGLRSFLYLLARILGDLNAAQKGRLGQRMARRAAGKAAGRVLKGIFRQ